MQIDAQAKIEFVHEGYQYRGTVYLSADDFDLYRITIEDFAHSSAPTRLNRLNVKQPLDGEALLHAVRKRCLGMRIKTEITLAINSAARAIDARRSRYQQLSASA